MKNSRHKLSTGIIASFLLVFSSYSFADEPKTYGAQIGLKTVNGFANIATGWLEIPKNIINTTNDTNIIWGVFGGTFKGAVVTVGRMGAGVADLVTFPLPTKPIARPIFIWQDFDIDTSFGPVFRLYDDETPSKTEDRTKPGGTTMY